MARSVLDHHTFVELYVQVNGDIPALRELLKVQYPNYDRRLSRVEKRIATLRKKGLLPLESGNKVEVGQILSGTSSLYDADGNLRLQWVKTNVEKQNMLDIFNQAVDNILERLPYKQPTKLPSKAEYIDDCLAVYPLGDVHLGMYANTTETDNKSDTKTVVETHIKAIEYLVSQAPSTEQAFIVDIGDYFHSDNNENRTAKSKNALDVDGRFADNLEIGMDLAVHLIDLALIKHKTVHWRSVLGNHNEHTAVFMNLFVQAYYRNEPRVVVHTKPSALYYYQFGKVLLGMTHGHQIKPDKLGEVMAVDCNDIWSSTKYRYFLTGHVHHQSVKEYPSCVVETFRTLTGKDTWHYSSGYRSGQDMNCIIYHKEYGEVSRNKVNIAKLNHLA